MQLANAAHASRLSPGRLGTGQTHKADRKATCGARTAFRSEACRLMDGFPRCKCRLRLGISAGLRLSQHVQIRTQPDSKHAHRPIAVIPLQGAKLNFLGGGGIGGICPGLRRFRSRSPRLIHLDEPQPCRVRSMTIGSRRPVLQENQTCRFGQQVLPYQDTWRARRQQPSAGGSPG